MFAWDSDWFFFFCKQTLVCMNAWSRLEEILMIVCSFGHVCCTCRPKGDVYKSLQLLEVSKQILIENDRGGYTIPAKGLYPYQWNWDSALVALGWATLDEGRAWQELEKLFSAQWEDGLVPHIVFHQPSPTYFPGPEIWGSVEQPMGSTGITQPPVAAITVRKLYETALNKELALQKLKELFPKLLAWHRWFQSARDPENTGLVATLHPWESGMDNSPAWDEALYNVPVDQIPPYVRKDLGHVDSAMRPKQEEYDRYLTLLYRFRAVNYDCNQLYFLSPFRVTDLCTNSVLYRANLDLRWLANELGQDQIAEEVDGWIKKARIAFDSLYDEEAGLYKSKDQLTGELVTAKTSAGFLPLFARVASASQAADLAATLERWLKRVKHGIPSYDPESSNFEPLRYWRGPVWVIINWMITDGLRAYGYEDLALRVEADTYELLVSHGINEYYDPVTGAAAGGKLFSWTAAMCLAWLSKGDGAHPAAAH
jgi:glycogen debranching enzyme